MKEVSNTELEKIMGNLFLNGWSRYSKPGYAFIKRGNILELINYKHWELNNKKIKINQIIK